MSILYSNDFFKNDKVKIPLFNSGKPVHSKYNPQKEAENFINTIEDADFFVVFGNCVHSFLLRLQYQRNNQKHDYTGHTENAGNERGPPCDRYGKCRNIKKPCKNKVEYEQDNRTDKCIDQELDKNLDAEMEYFEDKKQYNQYRCEYQQGG